MEITYYLWCGTPVQSNLILYQRLTLTLYTQLGVEMFNTNQIYEHNKTYTYYIIIYVKCLSRNERL